MVRALQRTGLAAVLALVLVGAAGSQEAPSLRGVVLERAMPSKALRGKLSFEVYLPPGYAGSGKRYPAIYFLHGLPASPYAFRGMTAFEAALDKTGGRAILVLPQGAGRRFGPRVPGLGNRPKLGDGDRERASALCRPALPYDREPPRACAGGALCRRLRRRAPCTASPRRLLRHGVVERLLPPDEPKWRHGARSGLSGREPAGERAQLHQLAPGAYRRRPTFFAFYVGRGDARFRAENQHLHRELAAAGVPHEFELYRGGHEQTLWNRHAVTWLRFALKHLARARA